MRDSSASAASKACFALAEAAVEHPDDTVRSALFSVVSETTLRQLVKEAKASEQIYHQKVRKVIRGSYSNHYRRMVPRLLQTLQFRCSNSAYRPVMDALELLGRHVDTWPTALLPARSARPVRRRRPGRVAPSRRR